MKTAKIRKENLKTVFEILEERYRIIGPRVVNGTVVLSEISFADIPAGYRDRQGAGSYRLEEQKADGVFTFSPGPTSLAEKMVAQWGMSDKVGPVNLGRGEEHPFLGRELALPKRYSDEMAWIMDQEIQRLIKEAESTAMEILTKNRRVLDPLAQALIKEEVLDKTEVERIIAEANDKGAPGKPGA